MLLLLRLTLRRFLTFVLALTCSASLFAAELTLQSTKDVSALTLTARRTDGSGDVLTRTVTAPGTVTLELAQGVWEVQVRGEGVWAPTVFVRQSDVASLRILRAAHVRLRTNAIADLRAEWTPLDRDGASGTTDCAKAEDGWTCLVPLGRYDLRFLSKGCAPEHRFDQSIANEEVRVEDPLRFVAGASLSGSVTAARGVKIPLESIKVRLVPDAKSDAVVTKANARGFFQFKGLAPGSYTLIARKGEFTARNRGVNVRASAVAELKTPLLLDRPKRLTIMVTPARDSEQSSWRVRVLSVDDTQHAEIISESPVGGSGETTQSVHAGTYDVELLRDGGELWSSRQVTIDDQDFVLAIDAFGQRIEGRVTLGDRPIAATLTFGGEHGVVVHANDDGRYSGDIPPGESERTILVQASTPTIKRTLRATPKRSESGALTLDITLPATTLIGHVISEARTPAPETVVTTSRDGVFEQVFTESDGSFQIAGFEPGTYKITADGIDGQSEPVSVTLEKNETNEVELVLRRYIRTRGRMSINDMPVIDAQIYALPRDGWSPTVPTARTDERGHFSLQLPPGTTTYDIFASHPAFEIVLGRVIHDPKKIVTISVHQTSGTLIVEGAAAEDLLLKHAGGDYRLAWAARQAGGEVESSRVTMPRLQPGEYTVCDAKTNHCASGYVPPNGTSTLIVR